MSCEIHQECGTTCKGVEKLEAKITELERKLSICVGALNTLKNQAVGRSREKLIKEALAKISALASIQAEGKEK